MPILPSHTAIPHGRYDVFLSCVYDVILFLFCRKKRTQKKVLLFPFLFIFKEDENAIIITDLRLLLLCPERKEQKAKEKSKKKKR